jgi:fucose 4-O-acetylase-like acetyltransferase
MATKRITYIDMAKGIGILLVVFGHSGFPSPAVNQWISSFHMPLFFLLSGILLSHTNAHEKPLKDTIKKKARTILVPYLFFSIFSILFSAILDADTFEEQLRIFTGMQHRLTDDMINIMAIALDTEVPEGALENRIASLKNFLLMQVKYECNRVR